LRTGLDAFTRALLNMGIVGNGGLTLAEKWAAGPRTYLGIAIEAFPEPLHLDTTATTSAK
jgi:hypothetical protein